MNPDLTCYGDDIRQLADLVGDFDLRSPMDVQRWYTREWQAVADALGFAQQFAAMPSSVPTTADRATAISLSGLAAFDRSLRSVRDGVTETQAQVQSAVIRHLTAGEGGDLWRVTVDPTTLPTGACFTEGTRSLRAFHPDTAPGWFGDGWPGPPPRGESTCGWTTPLTLHLGTFPWVYSGRLEAIGPGMRWTGRVTMPAVDGLQVAMSLLDPAMNLRQDARQVAAIYQHFIKHTAPLVARVPTNSGRPEVGRLYRHGGFLHVHQGSLHVAALSGPRGSVAAPAYNYVLHRFAGFFAVRRATVRALSHLAPDIQRIAHASTEPCLRESVGEDAPTH